MSYIHEVYYIIDNISYRYIVHPRWDSCVWWNR